MMGRERTGILDQLYEGLQALLFQKGRLALMVVRFGLIGCQGHVDRMSGSG